MTVRVTFVSKHVNSQRVYSVLTFTLTVKWKYFIIVLILIISIVVVNSVRSCVLHGPRQDSHFRKLGVFERYAIYKQ